jgi:hypothetical protein
VSWWRSPPAADRLEHLLLSGERGDNAKLDLREVDGGEDV